MKKPKTTAQKLREANARIKEVTENSEDTIQRFNEFNRAHRDLTDQHQAVMRLILEERRRLAERIELCDKLLELGGGCYDSGSPVMARIR